MYKVSSCFSFSIKEILKKHEWQYIYPSLLCTIWAVTSGQQFKKDSFYLFTRLFFVHGNGRVVTIGVYPLKPIVPPKHLINCLCLAIPFDCSNHTYFLCNWQRSNLYSTISYRCSMYKNINN